MIIYIIRTNEVSLHPSSFPLLHTFATWVVDHVTGTSLSLVPLLLPHYYTITTTSSYYYYYLLSFFVVFVIFFDSLLCDDDGGVTTSRTGRSGVVWVQVFLHTCLCPGTFTSGCRMTARVSKWRYQQPHTTNTPRYVWKHLTVYRRKRGLVFVIHVRCITGTRVQKYD